MAEAVINILHKQKICDLAPRRNFQKMFLCQANDTNDQKIYYFISKQR